MYDRCTICDQDSERFEASLQFSFLKEVVLILFFNKCEVLDVFGASAVLKFDFRGRDIPCWYFSDQFFGHKTRYLCVLFIL